MYMNLVLQITVYIFSRKNEDHSLSGKCFHTVPSVYILSNAIKLIVHGKDYVYGFTNA